MLHSTQLCDILVSYMMHATKLWDDLPLEIQIILIFFHFSIGDFKPVCFISISLASS